jgi:plastocyanin
MVSFASHSRRRFPKEAFVSLPNLSQSSRFAWSRLLIALALGATVAGALAGAPFPTAASAVAVQPEAAATVEVANSAFAPDAVTIAAGQSVAWVSRDSIPHTATGVSFDTGRLTAGQPVVATFDTAGEYRYNCAIHPNMAGTVVVQ